MENGLVIASASFPDKDTRTVGALEPVGETQRRSSGVVTKFVLLQVGWFVKAGVALITRMWQFAHVVHHMQLQCVTVVEYLRTIRALIRIFGKIVKELLGC